MTSRQHGVQPSLLPRLNTALGWQAAKNSMQGSSGQYLLARPAGGRRCGRGRKHAKNGACLPALRRRLSNGLSNSPRRTPAPHSSNSCSTDQDDTSAWKRETAAAPAPSRLTRAGHAIRLCWAAMPNILLAPSSPWSPAGWPARPSRPRGPPCRAAQPAAECGAEAVGEARGASATRPRASRAAQQASGLVQPCTAPAQNPCQQAPVCCCHLWPPRPSWRPP